MLISNTIIKQIISEINERKHFSIKVDLTLDTTTQNQLTTAVRYNRKKGTLVERFLGFNPP